MMKLFGLALVVLGILGMVYGGIDYSRQRTILSVGPITANVTDQKRLPFTPIVGGMALLAGILLWAVPRKRLAGASARVGR